MYYTEDQNSGRSEKIKTQKAIVGVPLAGGLPLTRAHVILACNALTRYNPLPQVSQSCKKFFSKDNILLCSNLRKLGSNFFQGKYVKRPTHSCSKIKLACYIFLHHLMRGTTSKT